MLIRPKNWETFQHYKDRNPTWIKLHKGLLDDYEFQRLPVASRALAPMLWLLASEHQDGTIDADHHKLSFRLRMQAEDVSEALKPLISANFFTVISPASAALAETEPPASPENKKEQVTSKTEVKPASAGQCDELPEPKTKKTRIYPPDFETFWSEYPTDKNMPKLASFKQWQRLSPEQKIAARAAIPGFKRYCAENKSWYRPVYAERFLSQEKFEGYAAEPPPDASAIAAARDRADKLMRRGKYAPEAA